jgi:putative colanic acid biosynthesis acetyltransferase WcaF
MAPEASAPLFVIPEGNLRLAPVPVCDLLTMPRSPDYRASDHIAVHPGEDAYTRPAFSLRNRTARLLWHTCWLLLYRPSPRPFHSWRSLLLRLFGATTGPRCYPGSKVWAPWNLVCADQVTAGDGVEIYNPATITCGSHVIFSQGSYICGATHDCDDPAFPLLAYRMSFGAYAWICARACVGPGVNVGEGAVLGLGSVATRDLAPWTIYAGNPAQPIRPRNHP